jgi:hypothetical protein
MVPNRRSDMARSRPITSFPRRCHGVPLRGTTTSGTSLLEAAPLDSPRPRGSASFPPDSRVRTRTAVGAPVGPGGARLSRLVVKPGQACGRSCRRPAQRTSLELSALVRAAVRLIPDGLQPSRTAHAVVSSRKQSPPGRRQPRTTPPILSARSRAFRRLLARHERQLRATRSDHAGSSA